MRRWAVEPGSLEADEIPVPDELAKHARRVLRLEDGELVELRDGDGGGAVGRLASGGRAFVVEQRHPRRVRTGPRIVLAQAVAKADKMDEVVRCAAELGVSRLVPFVSERTVPRKSKAVARWRRLAEDALRVSGRWFRMAIDEVTTLEQVSSLEAARRLVAVSGGARTVPELLGGPPPTNLLLLVGPEGGMAPAELEDLEAADFEGLDLGPAVLRTQTAGHAVVAALTLGWGLAETDEHGA